MRRGNDAKSMWETKCDIIDVSEISVVGLAIFKLSDRLY